MITFTQQHMDAITDLANNVQFKPYGWHIKGTGVVGMKIGAFEVVAELKRERKEEAEEGFWHEERIYIQANGDVGLRAADSMIAGDFAAESNLTLSQLRVLLIAAERIAAASAESERQWQNYANERDAMDKLTANLIKEAENENHL